MRRHEFHRLLAGAVTYSSLAACTGTAVMRDLGPRLDFASAQQRIGTLVAADRANPLISAAGIPRFYHHGKRVRRSVVLFHGFTNCPQQFDLLARQLHAMGANVFVPRIPDHGYADRLTRVTGDFCVDVMQRCAENALAVARGLGESVAVVGLSLGGTMAMWLAQTQDVAVVLPIAPFLIPQMVHLPYPQAVLAMHALRAAPNMYVWWDPSVKADTRPLYAYPGYMSHALAEIVFLGKIVYDRAAVAAPRARSITVLSNQNDNAVVNAVASDLLDRWRAHGAACSETRLATVERVHDIIDPTTFLKGSG